VQVFFYITAKSKREAKKIATILVKKKLVACANIFNNIQSFFLWKNKVNNSNETVIMGKTLQKNQLKIISEVKKIHSYDIPCVVFLKISSGSKEFLKWINKSVK
tara:strand:+ start:177 stop:488 length:312 start_codon:yes stop_codon:yes gene_type:complete